MLRFAPGLVLLAVGSFAVPASGQAPAGAGVVVHRDLAYVTDGHARQKLDLYLPEEAEGPAAEPRPLIVWVHGGGWEGGSKTGCPPLGAGFVGRGYAAASVGYRLTDAAPFPAQIEDCRAAIRWLRAHAKDYNLDPQRIGVWGGSAGGHLVALLGTAGDETAFDVGENLDASAKVQAVCDYFGPSDFPAFVADLERKGVAVRADSTLGRLFGGSFQDKTEVARKASPTEFVSKDDPPFFIVHGTDDRIVPLDQSERLHAALEKAGVSSTLKVIDGGGHGGGQFSNAETLGEVRAFFDKHLKAPAVENPPPAE